MSSYIDVSTVGGTFKVPRRADEYISKEARTAIVTALAGNTCAQVFTYPGCSHAFARHGGAHYDKDAAMLANGRTADFLAKHLKGRIA